MKRFIKYIIILVLFSGHLFNPPPIQGQVSDKPLKDRLNVLPDSINSIYKIDQLKHYLNSEIEQSWQRWKNNFEDEHFREKYGIYSQKLVSHFLNAIGKLPERTPLNPQITGVIKKNGYIIEKIIFESRPRFYVTALLFLPDSEIYTPPYPGVLIPCGHYETAKAHDEYQSMGALCALNGMAALVFDPIDQGERIMMKDNAGKTKLWGTRAHSLSGIKAILLGQNIAQYFIWDGIRALDYLEGRPEVNPKLLGITGNSGGGTQSAYLFMLDKRLKVSAPSCYIHNLSAQVHNSMGDAEQNIYGQLNYGLDHPDYLMSRAPAPVKILTATNDFFLPGAVWETFRYIKRYYTDLGFSENADILENNAGHNYNKTQREGAVRWLSRWLLNNDSKIVEPELQLLSPEDLYCAPSGNVMTIENARSVHELLTDQFKGLEKEREAFLNNDLNTIKDTIKGLLNISDPEDMKLRDVELIETIYRGNYKIEKLIITNSIGVKLPALKFIPEIPDNSDPVLFLSEYGKSSQLRDVLTLVEKRKTVLAVDLHGTGETKQKERSGFRLSQNLSWEECFKAYLLGKSIVGMRVTDILQCAGYLKSNNPSKKKAVEIMAFGEVGVPALHAVFLQPDLFARAKLSNSLVSWSEVVKKENSINQLVNAVHGALKYYDLPDLVEKLEGHIVIDEPLDATGFPFGKEKDNLKLSTKPKYSGLAGILYGRVDFSNPESPDPIDSLNCSWDNTVQKRGRDWASRWFGSLLSPYDGEVEITVYSNQKVELKINEDLYGILDYSKNKNKFTIYLSNGKFYPIDLKFIQDGVDKSFMKITWNKKGETERVINSDFLFYSPAQKFLMDNEWK